MSMLSKTSLSKTTLCVAVTVVGLLLGGVPAVAADTTSVDGVKAGSESRVRGGADDVTAFINEQLKLGWQDNEVDPSPVADDAEWMRRVSLDLVGHIPALEDIEKFLADKDKNKRARLIEELLESPNYVRNFTTIWTNLSIGQQTPRRVSRTGMMKFYREAFAKNRPWNEVVVDVVTAEGHFEENGAVNYILAQMQMPDDGVQLTAKTARLFLGVQVQCTQCHNHPFNEWKQDQFWQMNSFFRQVGKVDHEKPDPKTGRRVDDYSEVVWRDFSGPVFFEKRNGLMQVAYPIFNGKEVDAGPESDRRKQLGDILVNGEKPLIALAMVNRMWGHLFGYGFTRPVDDMGPHNVASHPVILERLADEFVKSGYDVKQLIRWIANTDAYQLTSRVTKKNDRDNPANGETPLFSHVYMKPMTAEQLYDSLIVATNAHKSGRSGWEASEKQRQEWLRQFVVAFGNDENEESSSFDGTIPQALMMMNGQLIRDAISGQSGSHLAEVMNSKGSDQTKFNQLYLSVLSRKPTAGEIKKLQQLFARAGGSPVELVQDLYWALLNSNEFIFVH